MLSATKAMYKITSPLNQPVLTAYSPKITAPRMLKALDKDEGVFNDASRSPSIITSMIKSCAKTGIAAVCSDVYKRQRQYEALLKLRLEDPELIRLVFQCNAKNDYVEGSINMIVRFYQGQGYSDFYVNFSPDQIPPLEAILSANDQYQLLYRGLDPQSVYWIEANGTSAGLDKSQVDQLARQLQQEQQQQSFSDLLHETKQIACRQSEDSYCFLSLALISFENGERRCV